MCAAKKKQENWHSIYVVIPFKRLVLARAAPARYKYDVMICTRAVSRRRMAVSSSQRAHTMTIMMLGEQQTLSTRQVVMWPVNHIHRVGWYEVGLVSCSPHHIFLCAVPQTNGLLCYTFTIFNKIWCTLCHFIWGNIFAFMAFFLFRLKYKHIIGINLTMCYLS